MCLVVHSQNYHWGYIFLHDSYCGWRNKRRKGQLWLGWCCVPTYEKWDHEAGLPRRLFGRIKVVDRVLRRSQRWPVIVMIETKEEEDDEMSLATRRPNKFGVAKPINWSKKEYNKQPKRDTGMIIFFLIWLGIVTGSLWGLGDLGLCINWPSWTWTQKQIDWSWLTHSIFASTKRCIGRRFWGHIRKEVRE